jgi:hypothetical protein
MQIFTIGYCAIDFSAVSSTSFQINQKVAGGGPFVAKVLDLSFRFQKIAKTIKMFVI